MKEDKGLKRRVRGLMVVMIQMVAECRQPVLHRVGGGTLGLPVLTSHNGPVKNASTSVIGSVSVARIIKTKRHQINSSSNISNLLTNPNTLNLPSICPLFVDFGFDKRIYNVLEVNSTSYENCVVKDFIYNITRGGRDVFNLTQAKTYFFLSGRGYCFEGMKVAIHVQEIPPEPLLPNSANGSQSYVYSHITLLAMLAIAASAWTFPY